MRAGTESSPTVAAFIRQTRSTRPDHTYAAERHAEDLAALLGALDAGKAHLVGSSYGAYIILVLALPATFDALAWTHKKEYVEWILSAKRDETRAKRIKETIERLRIGLKNLSDKG